MHLDRTYAAPYEPDGLAIDIHGYTEHAAACKEQFLRDGRRYLKAVGVVLAGYGFSDIQLSVNRAGIAVSGAVYGALRAPARDRYLVVAISACHVARLLFDRPDGVAIRAVWRTPHPTGKGYREGPNTWHDANLESTTLAGALLVLVGVTPTATAPTGA